MNEQYFKDSIGRKLARIKELELVCRENIESIDELTDRLIELNKAILEIFHGVGTRDLLDSGIDPNHYEDICPGATEAAREGGVQ
jgi:hypothetical protein